RWRYVGFEVVQLTAGAVAARDSAGREVCVVVIGGTISVTSRHGKWRDLGGRADPWSERPDAVYLPAETRFELDGAGEVELCWAAAPHGGAPVKGLRGLGT